MRGFHGETIGSNGYVTRAPAIAAAAVGCAVIEVSANRLGYTAAPVSLVGHTHDDRYYTESELNALLNAKFDKTGGVVSGFIEATGYIDAANIRCDGITVFDTSGASLNIGNTGGFTSATLLQGASGSSILRIGGSSSSFPALKQNNAELQVKLADDSAFANLVANRFYTYNVNGSPSIGSYSNAGIVVYGLTGTGRGVVACNALEVDAAYYVYWTGRSCLTSSADGLVHVQNFNLNESVDQVLVFGPGTTPGNGLRLKRPVGTSVLHVKNGNDSAYADLLASKLYVYNVNGNPWIESFSNSGIQVWGGAGGLGAVKAREFQVDPTGYLYFGARGIVASSANGVIHVHNYDLNDATADQVLALGPATSASNGVRLKRAMGTTVVNLRNGNDSADASLTCAHLTLTGLFSPGTYTVATLPAASANPGKTAEVTDSSVTTYRSTVAGGGSNRVNVKSNGTTWLVN